LTRANASPARRHMPAKWSYRSLEAPVKIGADPSSQLLTPMCKPYSTAASRSSRASGMRHRVRHDFRGNPATYCRIGDVPTGQLPRREPKQASIWHKVRPTGRCPTHPIRSVSPFGVPLLRNPWKHTSSDCGLDCWKRRCLCAQFSIAVSVGALRRRSFLSGNQLNWARTCNGHDWLCQGDRRVVTVIRLVT